MFENSKGELVPHCMDCVYHNSDMKCPDDCPDVVDEERGVLDCPHFKLKEEELD